MFKAFSKHSTSNCLKLVHHVAQARTSARTFVFPKLAKKKTQHKQRRKSEKRTYDMLSFLSIKRDLVKNNRRKRDLNPRLVDYDPTILTTELLRPKTDKQVMVRMQSSCCLLALLASFKLFKAIPFYRRVTSKCSCFLHHLLFLGK